MATNDELRGIKPFDCRGDSTSVGPRWRRWRKSFQFYVDGRGITAAARRKALLLHCAGVEVQEIFETLTDPGVAEGEDDDVYKAALRTLDAYFTPQVNVPYERHIFRQMKQEEHETVDQFVVRLSNQAVNCEFGATKNEQIRDQIIDKCKSTELRRKLLGKGHELTLAETQKIARSMELSQTQANGEVERQNRSLLKAMRVAHSEGSDWRKELQKFLLGYRSTPHATTGVSPAKLLFGREIRSKLPGVEELRSASNDSEVLDRDRERKQKGKDYADNLRGACESNLKEGDKVLLQKPRADKLSPSFEATPYEVVNKEGGHVEIKSPAGVHYKRNVTHLRKYEEDKSQETAVSIPKWTLPKDQETSQEEEPRVSTQHYALRPRCNRQPDRLKDYELG